MDTVTDTSAAAQTAAGSDGSSDKMYTQSEVDELIQAESGKLAKAEIDAFKRTEMPKLKTEAEKLAGMTAEQKAEYERQQSENDYKTRLAALEEREREASRRELRAEAVKALTEKSLPVGLADIVDYADAEACGASIEKIEAAFRKAVQEGVDARLSPRGVPKKGSAPAETEFSYNFQNVR
jgi:hypothetical protein